MSATPAGLVWLTCLGILMLVVLAACDQAEAPVYTAERGAAPTISEGFTPTPTLEPDPSPTATATPRPTDTPQPTTTTTATPQPTATPEPAPIETPTPQPTATPVPPPTAPPTPRPTFTPKPPPTATPLPTLTPDLRAASRAGDTGVTPPGMETYDRLVPDLMEKWEIPGGAIAVVKDGRLVLAKGYGLAEVENEEPVQPDSLFRIASISKPITAVAILKLVEDGLLDPDERAFDILDHLEPLGGEVLDPRVTEVTVRQLLQHSGGWDRDTSFDPMFVPRRVTDHLGVELPVVCQDIIRFMLEQPLDFDPGSQFAYSNFGYCVLGRIIEEKTGQTYEEYVQKNVLAPVGIVRMQVGGATESERVDGEVRYYNYPGAKLSSSVLAHGPARVERPYGGFFLETLDSHGGWIASAIDLVRFVEGLNGLRPPEVLKPESVDLMVRRPDVLWIDKSYYYSMGWLVRPIRDDANWWHGGSLPGTRTHLVRTRHGLTWAALFNSRPKDRSAFGSAIDKTMWQAVREVTTWPDHDLFPDFGYE